MAVFVIAAGALVCLLLSMTVGPFFLAYVAAGLCAVALIALAADFVLRRRRARTAVESTVDPGGEPTDEADEDNATAATDPVADVGCGPEHEAASGAAAEAVDPVLHEEPVHDEHPATRGDDATVVYVVRGRRRYHSAGCRLLADRDTDRVLADEAHEEGLSPCTVCLPEPARSP